MSVNKKKIAQKGFTLVELSIIIVIIGFLIAAISAGTNLIKQAALNSVISDMQGYQTSYNNFIIRYGVVPGDMTNASSYFPNCATTTNALCNGNGDGLISFATTMTAGGGDESYKAWRQLNQANMITNGITVIPASGWAGVEVVGLTVPQSKVTAAGYLIVGGATGGGALGTGSGVNTTVITTANTWADNLNNAVYIGKPSITGGLANGAITGDDAFNIDRKLDDGQMIGATATGAATGSFRTTASGDAAATTSCLASAGIYAIGGTLTTCISGLALN